MATPHNSKCRTAPTDFCDSCRDVYKRQAVSDTALTLAAADGRTLKFEAVPGKSFPEELKKGDTVRVSYTGWIEGEDTSEAVYASVSRAYA